MNVFAELQRRNVHRAAVFYAGAAWLLVQIATQVFPFFDIPNGTVRVVVIAALIGFPFAMLFSWFYEWTPQGIKRESEIEHTESITRETGKKLDKAIIAVLSLAVLVLLLNQFVLHRFMPSPKVEASANDKSIAVLPFENLSDDKANAYFSAGIQDLILTKLAGIGDLKVIARTSTEKYGSHPDDLRIVAQQLGVTSILEGSVQKAGNQALVNVQLIDARDGGHLWAEAYTRALDNIFGVEGEVAQAVADSLKARLTRSEQQAVSATPTSDPVAYDLFLRAEYWYDKAFKDFTTDGLDTAVDLYQQAVSHDPAFALAWAHLASARSLAHLLGGLPGVPNRKLVDDAQAAADQALRLQPGLADAHMALGRCQVWLRQDEAGAMASFDAALQISPNNPDALFDKVIILRDQGRYAEAVDVMAKAVSLDPRNTVLADEQGYTLLNMRRYSEAEASYQRAVALDPDNIYGAIQYANLVVMRYGDVPHALALIPGADPQSRLAQASLLVLQRRYSEAIAIVDHIPDTPETFTFRVGPKVLLLGLLYQSAGDVQQARALLLQARRQLQDQFDAHSNDDPPNFSIRFELAQAQAALGERDAAVATLTRMLALTHPDRSLDIALKVQYRAAVGYAQADRADLAVPILEKLIAQPGPGATLSPTLLRLDPVWNRIRDDPRFNKLSADAGAPHSATKP